MHTTPNQSVQPVLSGTESTSSLTDAEFVELYECKKKHFIGLAIYLTKYTGYIISMEDLLGESLLKAYKNKEKFKPGTDFRKRVCCIIYNTYINTYRKYKRQRLAKIDNNERYMSLVVNMSSHEDSSGLDALQFEQLNELISTLSTTIAKPFVMQRQGYHYEEIAESLNIPIGTVKSRIHAARTKLKTMILDLGIE